ncbi:MAG: TIR domain-containing protein [Hyphomicrobium sp.]
MAPDETTTAVAEISHDLVEPVPNNMGEWADPRKFKVFISYSRKDLDYADWLLAALNERGFEAYLDRKDIAPGEPWKERLGGLILAADTIVFVLSPDSILSEMCAWEVAEAERLSKRLLPVVWRAVDERATPPGLARLNWIFCNTQDQVPAALDTLAQALNTDIVWIREHTRLGELATRWQERNATSALLIRGNDLDEAERWIATRPTSAPLPTPMTQRFIAESRRASTRRRNLLSAILAAGLFVATGLAGLAYWQRGIAVEQRQIAQDNEKRADGERDRALSGQSLFLADLSKQQLANNDVATAVLLAIESVPDTAGDVRRPLIPEARQQLQSAARTLQERAVLSGHHEYVKTAEFSPDGRRVLTTSGDQTARVWDAETGHEISVLNSDAKYELTGRLSAAFSPDGRCVVTASSDRTARVWDAETGKEMALFGLDVAVSCLR